MLPDRLNVALKEWDVVCQALQSGRQMLLLRKGGIVEAIGGFELEQKQFLLYPTFLHQNREMLKADVQSSLHMLPEEPQTITITAAAEVMDIIRLTSRSQMDALNDDHIWTPPLIDMRFNYRPKNPLYLLILRTYLLPHAISISNTPAYAGCKSWVPLEQSIECTEATPVFDGPTFTDRQRRICSRIEAAGS